MKVPDSVAPPAAEQAETTSTPTKRDATKFARLLKAKKQGLMEDGSVPGGSEMPAKSEESPLRKMKMAAQGMALGGGAGAPAGPRQPLDNVNSPREVDKAQDAAAVQQLDALVQEIAVTVQERSTAIDIQMNSRTMEGLQIRLTAAPQGSVAIQFTTASPQVHELLTANIDSLSDALARRDVKVSELRISKRGTDSARKGAAAARGRVK
jgi:hypothetical protein